MSLHLLQHLENVFPELLCPPGISQLPPAPQPGARLSEELAASLIFSNLTASSAAAPGKSLAGGVPILPSLSSWNWVPQLCRRLKSTSSLSQEPQGREGGQLSCSVPPRLPPFALPRAFLALVPSPCKGHILLLPPKPQEQNRESAVPEGER